MNYYYWCNMLILCMKTWLCSRAQNEWMQNKQCTLEGAHYRQRVLHQDHPNHWEGWTVSVPGGSNLGPAFPPFTSWLFAPFLSFLQDAELHCSACPGQQWKQLTSGFNMIWGTSTWIGIAWFSQRTKIEAKNSPSLMHITATSRLPLTSLRLRISSSDQAGNISLIVVSFSALSGHVQDWECTKCLGACGAPMYLWGVTQGEWIPAECLSRNVIVCKLGYVHRGTLPEQKWEESCLLILLESGYI